MKITLDITKPVQTRNGKPARILATDINCNGAPGIVYAYEASATREMTATTHIDGKYFQGSATDHPFDLINRPEPVQFLLEHWSFTGGEYRWYHEVNTLEEAREQAFGPLCRIRSINANPEDNRTWYAVHGCPTLLGGFKS